MGRTTVVRLALALLGLAGIALGLRVSLHALSEPFDGVFVDDRLTVIRERPAERRDGGGRLEIGDRIRAVANIPVASRAGLDDALNALPSGPSATVQALRDGALVTLNVRRGGFPPLLLLSQAAVGLLTLSIGLLAYLRRPQPVTRALAAFGYALLLSLLTWTFGQDAGDPATVALFHLSLAASMGAILHFYLLFPEPTALLRRLPALAWLLYLPAAGWAAAGLLVYARWRDSGFAGFLLLYTWLVANVGFALYAAYLALGLLALLHTYRTAASPVVRRQIRWVFYGAFMSIVGVVLFGFLPIATGTALIPALDPQLGLLFALLFPISLLFAIFRYRLMDIDLVIKRTISYSLLGALVTAGYLGASQLALLVAVSALRLAPADLGPVNVLLGVAMGGLLLPARQRLQAVVDRRFFRERYEYQQSLAAFSARLAEPQTAGQLVALLTGEATQPMHIAWAGVLERTPDGRLLPAAQPAAPDLPPLTAGDPLPGLLRAAPAPLLLAQEGGGSLAAAEGPGLAALRGTGAALLLPLTAAGELVGLYALGPKQSGDIYSTEDLQWLTTLAQQAAAALRTAELQAEVLEADRRREALKRYLSPQVAEVVMTAGNALTLGGARCDVTVLFSDIRGFTTFSEQIPPEEVAHMLNQHLDAMTRAIFREGGTLDKYMGDCVMAVFGAPLPQTDHALRAVRAALAMQEAQAQLQQQWMAEGRPRLSVGIGLNSGEVIAGNFGSHERLEYTVIGDVVNTAQRIEAGAPGDQVLISADSYRQVEPWVEVEQLGPRAVKGRQAAVEVYRVIGLRPGGAAAGGAPE